MKNIESLKNLLRERGYKATPARLAIISAFKVGCDPMSAEDIYKKVKKQQVDPVTVYRTLTSFEKSGILKRVDLRRDSAYFELEADHHHHIVCTECGLLENFQSNETESLAKKIISYSSNFKKAQEHSFELFGLCKSCA